MRYYQYVNPSSYSRYTNINDERFIWPLVPFIGGALVGYIAGRPQYNNSYPMYYPYYIPYQLPYTYSAN